LAPIGIASSKWKNVTNFEERVPESPLKMTFREVRREQERSSKIQFRLIYIAPAPILSGFNRSHDGVSGGMEVLCSVLIF
jgi:hypothetical protein